MCVCVFAVPTEQPTFPPSQEDRLSLGDMANRKWEFTLAYFSQKKPPLWRSCRAPALSLSLLSPLPAYGPIPPANSCPTHGCSSSPVSREELGGRGLGSGPLGAAGAATVGFHGLGARRELSVSHKHGSSCAHYSQDPEKNQKENSGKISRTSTLRVVASAASCPPT